MPKFHDFMMRHGESGVQALVESVERYEGVKAMTGVSLEERWNAVMQEPVSEQRVAA